MSMEEMGIDETPCEGTTLCTRRVFPRDAVSVPCVRLTTGRSALHSLAVSPCKLLTLYVYREDGIISHEYRTGCERGGIINMCKYGGSIG